MAHLLHAHGFDPKNLVTGVAKNLPDGYIYGYIRDGGIHMPAYADAMNSDERWDVVMYVRQLEAQATNRKQPRSNRLGLAPAKNAFATPAIAARKCARRLSAFERKA